MSTNGFYYLPVPGSIFTEIGGTNSGNFSSTAGCEAAEVATGAAEDNFGTKIALNLLLRLFWIPSDIFQRLKQVIGDLLCFYR